MSSSQQLLPGVSGFDVSDPTFLELDKLAERGVPIQQIAVGRCFHIAEAIDRLRSHLILRPRLLVAAQRSIQAMKFIAVICQRRGIKQTKQQPTKRAYTARAALQAEPE